MIMTTRGSGRLRVVAVAVAVALGCAASSDAKGANSGKGNPSDRRLRKMSAKVLREYRQARSNQKMNVIVRFKSAPGTSENALVRNVGGKARRPFLRHNRSLAINVPLKNLESLADNPNVEYIAYDAPVAVTMDAARATAGVPAAVAPDVQLTGAGVTVAVMDSGVAPHPEISTMVVSADFVGGQAGVLGLPGLQLLPGDPQPVVPSSDPNGHGTHVAGIVVGSGSHSGGKYAGVAPGASLVSVRVLDGDGRGQTSDVIAGLEWVVANKDVYGIRVLNISLGHAIFEPLAQDPLVQAVEAAWNAGIVVVCSAGNAGRNGNGTVTSPCNSPKVITVGAINDHNTEDPSDDGVTTFSSRGPTRFDLLAKPDLLAPGNRIVSLRSAGSTLDTLFPERRRAGDPDQPALLEYYEMSGTSMSSPIVAGAAALMLQQEPWLTPATIKARLMLSARKPAAGNPFATGAGMLDIAAALATTGDVADAPSPHVYPDPETGRMGFENTAVSWGNPAFSLSALWSPSVMWAAESADTATLWSDGCLWPDSLLWPDANLWPDSLLWPDATLWSEAVLWPDEQIGGGYIPDVGEAQQVLVDDPS
jgi:serine protease AprX